MAVRGRPARQVKWSDRQHAGKYLGVELGAREGDSGLLGLTARKSKFLYDQEFHLEEGTSVHSPDAGVHGQSLETVRGEISSDLYRA